LIDPNTVTNYSRTQDELEEFFIFAVFVCGKKSHPTAAGLERLLRRSRAKSPMRKIRSLLRGGWDEHLSTSGLGQFQRTRRCFTELMANNLCLVTSPVAEIENLFGVGQKTARFFALHSRPDQQVAALDRWIRRWLLNKGENVNPDKYPTPRQYLQEEQIFLKWAKKLGKTPAELDLELWIQKNEEEDVT